MRVAAAAAMVVLGLCAFAAGPAVADDAPLAFVTPTPLTTTCAALAGKAGVAVRFRNETGQPQDVHLALDELSAATDEAVSADQVCGGLTFDPPPSPLEGGKGAGVALHATLGEEGTFSGSLVLAAASGKVARLALQIAPAAAPAKELAAAPLVESQSLELEGSETGPVWIPIKTAEAPPAGLPEQTVGAVSGAGGPPVPVVYNGKKKKLSETTSAIGLEFGSGASQLGGLKPGSYSGSVDLVPADKEKGKVSLDVKVADRWTKAAALIAVGILLGLVLQWLSGVVTPRGRLKRRITKLTGRHSQALAKMKEGGGEAADWGKYEIGNLDKVVERLRELLEERLRLFRTQTDKTVLEDMETRVGAVEAQIDLLKEMPEHAGDLETALQALPAVDDGKLPPRRGTDAEADRPNLVAAAKKALAGKAIKAADLKPRLEEIDARVKQARIAQELEERLADLWKAAQAVKKDGETTEVKKLEAELAGIRHLLWTAESAEDLDETAKAIQTAAKATAALWAGLAEPKPLPKTVSKHLRAQHGLASYIRMPVDGALISSDDDARIVDLIEVPATAPSSDPAPPTLPPSPPAPRLSADAAEHRVEWAWVAQLFVVVVTALVVLAAGLAALYVGKTWGSSHWDALGAVTWGLGLQATALGLAASIDGLSGLQLPWRK